MADSPTSPSIRAGSPPADILGQDHSPADYSAVPRVTFTDPEVGSVGLTEEQAREQGLNIKTGIAQTASSARGWIHGPGAEHGLTKLVADADTDVLVGASRMGPAAGEVLGLLILAVKERGTGACPSRAHLSLPDVRAGARGRPARPQLGAVIDVICTSSE